MQDQRNLRENGIDIGDKSGYNAEDILQVAVGALGRARQVFSNFVYVHSGVLRESGFDRAEYLRKEQHWYRN